MTKVGGQVPRASVSEWVKKINIKMTKMGAPVPRANVDCSVNIVPSKAHKKLNNVHGY